MVGLAVLSVWGGLTVLTCAIVLMRLLASMTGLVQACMEGQRMLLLDEPFNALDADSVVRVKQLIRDLLADGRTIVFTSHNAPDIEELATRHCRIESHRLEPVR